MRVNVDRASGPYWPESYACLLRHWHRTPSQQPWFSVFICLHGVDALEPALLDWQLASAEAH